MSSILCVISLLSSCLLTVQKEDTFEEKNIEQNNDTANTRVKRDADKFQAASTMPQVRVMRVFMQLFKNLVAGTHVGGSHPLHKSVPPPVVYLFKDKIVEFFMPDVGVEHKTKSH